MSHGRDQGRTQGKRSVAETQAGGAAASDDAAGEDDSTTKRRKVEKQGKNARRKLQTFMTTSFCSRKDIILFNEHSQLKRKRNKQP